MIAGATASPVQSSIEKPRSKPSSRRAKATGTRGWDARSIAMVAVATLGVALALTAFSAWEASRSNRSSQQSRLQGHAAQAIDRGLLATRLDPGRAEYWHGLGLAYVSAARWADASVAFERASKLAPYDVRYIGDHARAQLFLAGSSDGVARAKAVELSAQALRVDPNNPRAQLTRAAVMQVNRDLAEAIRAVERALALDPRSTSAALYVTATQIYLDSGRPADAVRIAREGVAVIGPTLASVAIRYELGRALVSNGQPREALAELDVALQIQPNNTTVQRLRADIAAGLIR